MGENIKVLSDSAFDEEVLKSEKPMLVDFWAEWCMPCRMVAPELEKLAEEKKDVLVVGKLNVDENPLTAARYQIRSIPTMILFKDGKEARRLIGAMRKEKILAEIQDLI